VTVQVAQRFRLALLLHEQPDMKNDKAAKGGGFVCSASTALAKSLGWRLLGEPHHFRAARIRVSGGRPKCGARRHGGRLPPAESIDRWRISKNLNRICTGRLYRTFDQAATVSFPILGYVIRTLLSFPTDRAGILLAQLAVEPDA
jgi:hypothetical protein